MFKIGAEIPPPKFLAQSGPLLAPWVGSEHFSSAGSPPPLQSPPLAHDGLLGRGGGLQRSSLPQFLVYPKGKFSLAPSAPGISCAFWAK